MGRGTLVTAPDGTRWLVRRRWLDGPLPDLGASFHEKQDRIIESSGLELLGGPGDDLWGTLAALVLGLLVILVLLPLLGVALELIAPTFVLFSGVFGRIFLGRPWVVEAVPQGGDAEPIRIPVKGWRRAGEAAGELERGIAAGGPPDPARLDGRTF